MAKTISAKLDEEEKKIIDLIRQHKLDSTDMEYLLKFGARGMIEIMKETGSIDRVPAMQRDLDKYTRLLEALEKGE